MEILRQSSAFSIVSNQIQSPCTHCQSARQRTSGGSGVLLDGPALADEGVLGAGARGRGAHQAALEGGADGGRPQLGGEARRGAHDLALREHGE